MAEQSQPLLEEQYITLTSSVLILNEDILVSGYSETFWWYQQKISICLNAQHAEKKSALPIKTEPQD